MLSKTKSSLVDETKFTEEHKNGDGGRALLLEVFDLIRSEKTEGTMTVHFGPGGSIRDGVHFREAQTVPQKDRLDAVGTEV